jgi:signal transduction histidine kinase
MPADLRVPLPVDGVRLSLWRAAALYRVAALGVCLFLILRWQSIYARPTIALLAAAVMTGGTAAMCWLAVRGRAHRLGIVVVDTIATIGLTLLSIPAQTVDQRHGDMVTLTTLWAAGPTIETAFLLGWLGGVGAALLQFASTVVVAGDWHGRTLYSGVLLLVTGAVVGFVAQLAVRAEDDLRAATAARAAAAERERLARSIHDGVLQVLGLVHRNGREAGGRWEVIAAAAAEQEAALRGLITSRPQQPLQPGSSDLAELLRGLRGPQVTVSTPADPVLLEAATATEIRDAVRAALHNVSAHAGRTAQAWVLLESLDTELRVTVRDDGVGMPAERLAAARAEGRIGVARSVCGRITGLGGQCTVSSTPGAGTEIDMVVPR